MSACNGSECDDHVALHAAPRPPSPGDSQLKARARFGGAFGARKALAFAAAFAVVGFAAPACAVATPQNVHCGAHLKATVHLTADLVCPLGNGITLDGPITLDLGGHKLIGGGTGISGSIGVTGYLGGTSSIVNGQIQGWETGVSENNFGSGTPGGHLRLDKVTITGNGTGADVEEVAFSVFSSRFLHNGQGLFGFFGRIDVHGSTFVGDGAVNGGGGNLTIDLSTFDGTGSKEPPATCSESGLTVTRSTIKNYALAAGGFDCNGVTLTGNTFSGNPLAFQSTGDLVTPPVKVTDGEQIVGNTFTDNGIAVESGVSGRIANNTFTGNTTGLITTSNSVLITGNTFTHNKSSGIHDTTGAGTRIGNNTGSFNGRWAIFAPGAQDLGGNVAFKNANTPQCVGVVCTVPVT